MRPFVTTRDGSARGTRIGQPQECPGVRCREYSQGHIDKPARRVRLRPSKTLRFGQMAPLCGRPASRPDVRTNYGTTPDLSHPLKRRRTGIQTALIFQDVPPRLAAISTGTWSPFSFEISVIAESREVQSPITSASTRKLSTMIFFSQEGFPIHCRCGVEKSVAHCGLDPLEPYFFWYNQ